MTDDLTILCVTNYGAHSAPFLSALDGIAEFLGAEYVEHDGSYARCLEHVLDDAVAACPDGYILRLDDDELPTDEMIGWLAAGRYQQHDHWAFPRLNLYPDAGTYIRTEPLFPDLQTRLSVKAKSGGRAQVHEGSPFGTGEIAPVAIEHHKFIVRPLQERRALLERYERVWDGAGSGHFAAFSVPEDLADVELVVRTQEATA